MRRDDRIRLQHMLDAAREALSFVQERHREDLDSDRLLVLGLVKAIEIIGEAAYQVSESTRAEVPSIPWEDSVSMRHRLVHAYFDINLDILWRTVQDDLPTLVSALESMSRNWRIFLQDILESTAKLRRYTEGMNLESFIGNEKEAL